MKVTNIFKVIITACLVITFTLSLAACKEASVVEEKATAPSETIETTSPTTETVPETTQETAAPTTTIETTPQLIEYKGSVFPLPEFSEANPKTGEILALAGNPYGVEAGTKIGQCIKDAFALNGKMENSIALSPGVIEYMQKKMMEENHEFRYPLPFDLQKAKGIKITEIEHKFPDFAKAKILWNEPKELIISGIPLGTKIFSPVSTSKLIIWQEEQDEPGCYSYSILFGVRYRGYNDQYDLNYKGNSPDAVEVVTFFTGAEIIPPELKKFPPKFAGTNFTALQDMKSEIGEPLAEIKENKFLDPTPYEAVGKDAKFSMTIYSQMSQWTKDGEKETGFAAEGSAGLLTMGDKEKKEEIIVSFMPANE